MARKIEVQIVGDASSFHKALGQATNTSSKFGSVLGGAVKAGAYAAAGGVVALGAALKIGIDEFNDQQKVAAQTQAVLKSTGGAANVTAKHVKELGDQLLNVSGVDDEVIKSGENMLLTFTHIRNEAGKNNDIFDQATKLTLDLSTAMGLDMKQAALQVGKALNDPARGFTRLQRIGVAFSDQQANLIKHFEATGQTAKAQKVILQELQKEFGGSAKAAGQTLAGQLDVLKEKFKNAAGEVVAGLLPYVTRLANFAFPLAVSAIKHVAEAIKGAIKWLAQLGSHFEILGGRSASAGSRIRSAWNAVVAFFNAHVLPIIRKLQGIFQDAMAAIAATVQSHGDEIRRIASRIGAALQAIGKVAIPILRFALVTVLPKALGIAITALDKITGIIATVIGWFQKLAGWIDTVAGKLGDIAGKIASVKDAAGGVLSGIGLVAGVPGGGVSGAATAPTLARQPIQVNIHVDRKVLYSAIVEADKDVRRQNGRSLLAGA